MNIAIITFSDFNTNYGSILQAFALKFFLQEHGHKVTFIKYREYNKFITHSFKSRIKKYAVKAYHLLYTEQEKKRRSQFKAFIQSNIPHTHLYTSEQDLESNLNENFDAYICGSDQIWNINILGGLREPYFLKFVPQGIKKIAYGPSMGEYEPVGEELVRIKELLESFDFISTREQSSSIFLSTVLKKKVLTVVDPTFMLDSTQWLSVIGKKELPKGDYAVCYCVRRNPLAPKLVSKLKEIYNVPIYNVSDNLINVPGTQKDYIACGPEMFVNLVAGAKFCVGTSFHLAVFSTIFNKHCFIAGSMHNKNRILGLFGLIGRENHLIFDNAIIEDSRSLSIKEGNINHELLDKMILKSKKSLLNALKDE